LFYLPFEYPIKNGGAYLAVVLILWPLVVVITPTFIEEVNRFIIKWRTKKDWYYLTMTIDESGKLCGTLRHKEQEELLYFPIEYQFYYIKTDINEPPGFQAFIQCTDQNNKQFILSATFIWLPEKCKNAIEITNIPEEWYLMLFLKCNPSYLHKYLRQLTKLETKAI